MNDSKPCVDFRGFLDNVPAMLRITQSALPEMKFRELKSKTEKADTWTRDFDNREHDINCESSSPSFSDTALKI